MRKRATSSVNTDTKGKKAKTDDVANELTTSGARKTVWKNKKKGK